MLEKRYIRTITVPREGGAPVRLSYGLVTEARGSLDEYGIFIRDLSDGDYAEVRAISPDGRKVLTLLESFIRNEVTPCTMWDILQDLL